MSCVLIGGYYYYTKRSYWILSQLVNHDAKCKFSQSILVTTICFIQVNIGQINIEPYSGQYDLLLILNIGNANMLYKCWRISVASIA